MKFKQESTLTGFIGMQNDELSIKTIPMLYRADAEFALSQNSAIMNRFLKSVMPYKRDWKYVSIDSRVHMLMPGWYPCIPGWHVDDFYRKDGGQPLLSLVESEAPSEHFMVAFGDSAMTEFIDELEIDLPSENDVDLTVKPLSFYHDQVIDGGSFKTKILQSGGIYRFSPVTFHRGMPAEMRCWRAFIRLTFSNHREPKNEIRTQTQVYVPSTGLGW